MTQEEIKERVAGSTAVAVKTKADEIMDLVKQMTPALDEVLAKNIKTERFARIVLSAMRQTPKLMECSKVSLANALMQSAALGLEPNTPLGHAYLIPYNTRNGMQVNFIVGYKGLLDLARRSGEIVTIHADAVYENDEFEAYHGRDAMLRHVPCRRGERGKIVTYYAYAQLKGGGFQFEEMTPADVEAIRLRSKAADSGPWQTDYEAMAKKTVLRKLCKTLPQSVQMAYAVEVDDAIEPAEPSTVREEEVVDEA